MKKKEGFTLLELLSVIVILAVIALIAVPIIMNVIESSKKGAFKETTRNLYQAAEMQEAKKMLTTENAYCSVYNFSNNQESEFLSEEELDKIFGKDNYSKLQSYKYDRVEKLNIKGKLPTEGIICSCNNERLGRVSDGIYTAIPDKNDIIVEKGDDLSSVDQTKAVIKKIETEVTATTIKVTVDAEVGNYAKIKSYEYNINGGKYQKGTGNTYTFEELEFNTEYTIGIKITTNAGIVTEGSTKATTEYALLSVTANGYTGVYDGNAHGITVTSSGATIKYGTSEGNYNLSSNPTYTNAGTYTVYYQVTKEGYRPVEGSKTITITKAEGSITLSKTSESLSYPNNTTVTVTNNRSNGILSCTSSNTNIATCSISGTTMTVTPGTTPGVATITVTSASTNNYNATSTSFSATVGSGLLSVTANGYTGVYDGSAHGITVTSSGATIKYGISSGTYNLSSSPTYTNAGTYTVYYQVTKTGYQTVTGSKTVTISKANGSITLSKTSGSLTYPNSTSFTVTQNTSNGTLSCTSNNTSIATCSISGTTVTVNSRTTAGVATLTVTSASTTNYNSASASFSATVSSGTLSVTANGYDGPYDGKAHGITVTSSGATIKYGTTSGTYNLSSSPTYTDSGMYTVYYQVTRAGYKTVTGSKQVIIKDMVYAVLYSDGTLAFNATGKVDSSKTVTMNVTDITGRVFNLNTQPWYSYKDSITKVVFEDKVKPTSTTYWFYNLSNLTIISNIQNLDTSKVTDMSYMFWKCESLTSLNVSNFDTSNVINMRTMFSTCKSLTSLNVSHFDTSKVTDMSNMFYYCESLTSLDVSNFDTRNVTNMTWMFGFCSSLTGLNVSNFDTSNVANMFSMFSNCSGLTSLDVSNFNTSKVTDMSYMFWKCESLTSLNVSNFDTSNVTNMRTMFSTCKSLTSLNVSHFDTSKVTDMSNMFYYCSNLSSLTLGRFDISKVTSYSSMFNNSTNLKIVKTTNSTSKTWLEARLKEAGVGATVTLGS